MKTKLSILSLIGAFSFAHIALAIGPYRPPCENQTHKLENVRFAFELCIEHFTSSEDGEHSEKIKERCSSEFGNVLSAIAEFKMCRDHTKIFRNKK